MFFARRNKVSHGGTFNKRRSKKGPVPALETLESRVLLTGETTVIAWGGQLLEAAKNQYIIKASAATTAALQKTLLSKHVHADRVIKLGKNVWAMVDTTDDVGFLERWAAQHKGYVVTPNLVYHKAGVVPDDIGTADWQFQNTGQTVNGIAGTSSADIGATLAWGITTGPTSSTGVTSPNAPIIAVLDTGLDTANADFAGNLWVNPRENPTDQLDNDGDGVVDDVNGANFSDVLNGTVPDNNIQDTGHGNDIAGLIGAIGNNGAGTAGVAWHVKLLSVKVFTGTDETLATDASIIAGLEYVMALKRQGVNIVAINMSFGRRYLGNASGIGDTGNATGASDAPAILVFDAMKRAAGLGMVIVTAAGNGGTNDDTSFFVPAHFSSPRAITVAASTNLDTIALFSNYGPNTVQIAAPGDTINAISGTVSGSSYAAALVSGEVALLKSLKPSLTADQIVSLILNGADKIPALTPYVQQGRRLNLLRPLGIVQGNPKPIGWVDSLSQVGVSGWMFDQTLGNESITGIIKIDGVQVDVTDEGTGITAPTFNAANPRADLTAAVGSPNHGFQITFNTFLSPGAHTIQIYANDTTVDPLTGKIVLQPNSTSPLLTPVLLFQSTVLGNVMPTGGVDTATFDGFSGWAIDPNLSTGTQVRIDVDGSTFATVTADQNHATAPVGSHGFTVTNPRLTTHPDDPWLSAGVHRVDFYAIDDYTGDAVLIGTRTVIGDDNAPQGFASYDPTTRTITGSIQDADAPFDPVSLQVVIDGVNGKRQYLDAIAPGSTHTFTIQVPLLPPGDHELRLFAFDTETGTATQFLLPSIPGNTAPSGSFDTANADTFDGWVHDVESTVYYRIDIDGSIGQIALADGLRTDLNFGNQNIGFNVVPPTLSVGTHTATLWAVDSTTLVLTQIAQKTFQVVDDQNKRPVGALDTFGVAGITGWATDPDTTNNTASGGITINVIVDNASSGPAISVVANRGRTDTHTGQGFTISRTTLAGLLSNGYHYVQVFAQDSTDSSVQILLQEGEIQIGNVRPAGAFTNVNFRTLNGSAKGAANDFAPLFLIDVNNLYYQEYAPVAPVADPTVNSTFSLTTPLLTAAAGNTAHLKYFDFITGALVTLATKPIPVRPINQFVNGGLLLSSTAPTGSFEAASEGGFVGWVGDEDTPSISLQYRVDIDGIITGQLATASLARGDLINSTIFSQDQNHGFSIAAPTLTPGTHSATLWAVDSETGQAVAIGTRTFTVRDTANRRPIGVVSGISASAITGWAQDPTTPAAAVTVNLFIDNSSVPTAISANGTFPSHNGHGFSFDVASLALSAGEHYFQVVAVDSTNPAVQVTLRAGTLEVAPQMAGFFDVANYAIVAGWAEAPASDTAPVFQLDLNGQPYQILSEASGNLMAEAIEGSVKLRRFSVAVPPTASTTANTYSLWYMDKITGKNVLLAVKVVPAKSLPFGFIDIADNTQIAGWAISASLPDAKVGIQLLIDNQPALVTIAQLDANLPPSLQGHAFQATLPTGLSPGVHALTIRMLDPISGDYQLLGVRSITVV